MKHPPSMELSARSIRIALFTSHYNMIMAQEKIIRKMSPN